MKYTLTCVLKMKWLHGKCATNHPKSKLKQTSRSNFLIISFAEPPPTNVENGLRAASSRFVARVAKNRAAYSFCRFTRVQDWVRCLSHWFGGAESWTTRHQHPAQDRAVPAAVPGAPGEVREDAKWRLRQAEVPGREQGGLEFCSSQCSVVGLHVQLQCADCHLFLHPHRWKYCITSSSCSTML